MKMIVRVAMYLFYCVISLVLFPFTFAIVTIDRLGAWAHDGEPNFPWSWIWLERRIR